MEHVSGKLELGCGRLNAGTRRPPPVSRQRLSLSKWYPPFLKNSLVFAAFSTIFGFGGSHGKDTCPRTFWKLRFKPIFPDLS